MSGLPTNPSDAVRQRNPHLFQQMKTARQHNAELVGECELTPKEAKAWKAAQHLTTRMPESGKRIRQSGVKMNKLETEFHEYLKALYETASIYPQAITFAIANGVRYTPDFVVFSPFLGIVEAYEVKGFMREDAAVKLKVAASKFPNIKWYLVYKTKGLGWSQQEVLS